MTLERSQPLATTMAIDNEHLLVSENLIRIVDDMMLRSTTSEVQLLQDASHHIINAGGKRIRPRMLLLTYMALGGTDIDYALPVAASIELVHTASVVHDDINDHGMLRRGRPSVNAKWGRTFALLTGDFLFTKVYELMAEYSEANKIFAQATKALVEGETLQAAAVKERNLSREIYMRIIALKTAELFRAATELGAILANADKKTQQALGEFGFNVGMAFQIIDDILDITGDTEQLGKTAGIDVEQGKGFASVNPDEVDPMVAIRAEVLSGDTIEQGKFLAKTFVDNALDSLDVLPDSEFKAKLVEITNIVINRSH